MKICVVGNSHIAALKLALSYGRIELPALQIDFWGGAGPLYHKLFVEQGILKAPADVEDKFLAVSDGKHRDINPDNFGLLVFHGASLDTFRPVFAISKRLERNPNLSQSAVDAVITEWLKGKLTFQLATELRKVSKTPIIFSPMPSPSEDMRLQPDKAKVASVEIYARVMEAFMSCARTNGFDVLCQPPQTLSSFPNHTKREYSTDSVQLHDVTVQQRADDVMHMNERYGVEVLKALDIYVKEKLQA